MLTKSFLTQLIPPRIGEVLRRLQADIWTEVEGDIVVRQTESSMDYRRIDELADADFSLAPEGRFFWGPKYAQRWFRLELPEVAGSGGVYLHWRDQAEATAYRDGVPVAGIDLAHPYCPLGKGARALWIESVCIRSGIWLDGNALALAEDGSEYEPPRLLRRNDLAWSLYHDLRVLLDIMEADMADTQPGLKKSLTDPVRHTPSFQRATPLFRRWCMRLDDAIDVFDAEGPEAFQKQLAAIYCDFPADPQSLRAVLTGHAHIDLVWLWPERVGEFKAVHTWATQVRLLGEYPEYKFGYSQPASYEAVERKTPALYNRVRELIGEGRWEATGASYVESDTQLPCGEALLRSLRLGQRRFIKLRGEPARVFWLPDVFGYSGCVPQLLKAVGVTGFFTCKLSWSTINRFPHTSFRWRGFDGSEVTSHIVRLHDYNESVGLRNLREDSLQHQQAAVHPEYLVPTGYGDGGGGPTEEMCERARRLANLAGSPRTGWGGIEEFFQRLDAVKDRLPVAAGELMLELHRGIFTTHGRMKAAFRALERALQTQEAVYAAGGAGPVPEHAWERLIFAQFHDCIPGSSIWEVYAETIPELEKLGADAMSDAVAKLGGTEGADRKPCLFNPLPLPRVWRDESEYYSIPPLSGAPFSSLDRLEVDRPEASSLQLKNRRVRAAFSNDGRINTLIVDDREVSLVPGPVLRGYFDHPATNDAWDLDRPSLVAGVTPERTSKQPVIEQTETSASISFEYTLRSSHIIIKYLLHGHESVLRIVYDIDWREPQMCLKGLFPTGYLGKQVRYGTPYGSVLRSQSPGYEREEAAWEVSASRWLVVMDDAQREGLFVVAEAKYGVTVSEGCVGVSLLRSALVTEADFHPKIRSLQDRPRFSDMHRHEISLAIGRFDCELPATEQPAALADLLFTPCLNYSGNPVSGGFLGVEEAPTLLPAWCEPLGKGWALRMHETDGRRGVASLKIAPGWRAAICDVDKEPDRAALTAEILNVPYEPYKIITICFQRDAGQ
ncbi:alpha-mannosidase [Ereboglobus luteus]|uniref:Alpha-mannosidase n=1 Tax=Ereboglobus luteus TaxID=1796921 RepID=A0A2U8E5U5_9BACT|nr:alpha-mannosidase [Ereboglobus luteus]AWI10221.1 alpha-mannosidase [Ereboglobus luteus]